MINPISQETQPEPTAPTQVARPAQSQPQFQSLPKDTVTLSAAAKAMQEALETPAQTAQEAARGDNQAKRLLAREAVEKANG